MMNKIFSIFIIIGILYSIFTNNIAGLNNSIIDSSKKAFTLLLSLIPIISLWNGLMQIAIDSGLMKKLEVIVNPLFRLVFKDIPKNHYAIGLITSSLILNSLGAGNASTPMSLKAMEALQELNSNKDTASKDMIKYVILSTTGFTIMPTTVIGLLMSLNDSEPTSIILPIFIASSIATIFGLFLNYLIEARTNV